jgi:hypothetical protein
MSKQNFTIASPSSLREVMLQVWQCVCAMMEECADSKGLKITVDTASRRSLDANAKMWAMLGEISAQVDWYGQRLKPEEWKDVFSASLKKQKAVPALDSGFVVVGGRTSEMSVKEMAQLIELMNAFAAEKSVRFSAPEWI